MSLVFQHGEQALPKGEPAVLVTLASVQGSAPREAGTRMLVYADGRFSGTIGGGALEWQALAEAQALLRQGRESREITLTLGPDLGQCCGGRVTLRLERVEDGSLHHEWPSVHAPTPVFLFGAGHVGRALVLALAPLPFATRWIDSRHHEFPTAFPPNVTPVSAVDPVGELAGLPDPGLVLILTHSHALDLQLADAALRLPQARCVGVIGSLTKRARFLSQLRQMGHDETALLRFCCPIGLPDLGSKEPAVIAAGVAVHLLQWRVAVRRNGAEDIHLRQKGSDHD